MSDHETAAADLGVARFLSKECPRGTGAKLQAHRYPEWYLYPLQIKLEGRLWATCIFLEVWLTS